MKSPRNWIFSNSRGGPVSVEKRPGPGCLREIRPKIGKYEIRAVLGEGATGVVYEAYDQDVERRVAIKTLHPHLLKGKVGAGLLARFKREAISAARCLHPNIVALHEYGQHGSRPYIVMEYVDGMSVQKFIKRRQRLGCGISLKRSLVIMSGLLSALHAAHRLGIVHRDVKASNVLIAKGNSHIKLADFGMARIAENSDLTMIGSLIGTPRYMAPELRFGLEADARADLFSAARLFLELIKHLPAHSKIPCSHLPVIAGMPPGNRIDYSAVYPTALIPVLVKALDVDRGRRYESAAELSQAIKDAMPCLRRPPVQSYAAPADSEAQLAAAATPASEDELGSMTDLLTDYLGPNARLVIEEHETRSTSADNLALEISREIPEPGQQQAFLERWQVISASRRAAIEAGDLRVLQQPGRTPNSPRGMLNRISHEFAHYFEPISRTLLRQGANRNPK